MRCLDCGKVPAVCKCQPKRVSPYDVATMWPTIASNRTERSEKFRQQRKFQVELKRPDLVDRHRESHRQNTANYEV